jgi:hypothetical protein
MPSAVSSTSTANAARTNITNTFDLGQTIRGHSAIGSGATIDHDDTFDRRWGVTLYVADATVTDLTNPLATTPGDFGTYSTYGTLVTFNPTGTIARDLLGFSLEYTLQGAGDYNDAEGVFGGVYYEGSGTFHRLNGLDYTVTANAGAGVGLTGLLTGAVVKTAGVVTHVWGANISANALFGGSTSDLRGTTIALAVDSSSHATVAYGLYLENDGIAGTGTLYGLWMDVMTGATVNYALWTDGGETRHKAGAAAVTPLTLQLDASQSADAFAVLASNGTTKLARIDKSGYQIISRTSAPADAALGAGEMALWFDSTNGLSKLMVKGKSANGSVVTGSVVLT